MHDLRLRVDACGVLIDTATFAHLATAWSCAPGEWVSCWDDQDGERPLPPTVRLMSVADGTLHTLGNIEYGAPIIGFTATAAGNAIAIAPESAPLHKFDPLWAIGFPAVLDHPAFALHRGSLDAERYYPYLCPWTIPGHCALFSGEDGWITGRCYAGMEGAPVLDEQGRAVGILTGGKPSPEHPPLTRFRRLA